MAALALPPLLLSLVLLLVACRPHLLSFPRPEPVRAVFRDRLCLSDALLQLSRAHGPVFAMRLGASRVVVTSHPGDIAHVGDARVFARAPKMLRLFATFARGGLFSMSDRTGQSV